MLLFIICSLRSWILASNRLYSETQGHKYHYCTFPRMLLLNALIKHCVYEGMKDSSKKSVAAYLCIKHNVINKTHYQSYTNIHTNSFVIILSSNWTPIRALSRKPCFSVFSKMITGCICRTNVNDAEQPLTLRRNSNFVRINTLKCVSICC